jgi:PadR family transcriptional regulator, regulatory protein PadR
MRRRPKNADGDLLGGTLDMLVLRVLLRGPMHGFGIALSIANRSHDVIFVEEGSLYPALHRLEDRGWISAAWGTTDNNRRARFYTLTAKGRRELAHETARWTLLSAAVTRVMDPLP